jgi:hypothetical protein
MDPPPPSLWRDGLRTNADKVVKSRQLSKFICVNLRLDLFFLSFASSRSLSRRRLGGGGSIRG